MMRINSFRGKFKTNTLLVSGLLITAYLTIKFGETKSMRILIGGMMGVVYILWAQSYFGERKK
jgi:hypothetical protein